MISGGDFERSDSRKRRRVSERRRVFSRIGLSHRARQHAETTGGHGSLSTDPSSWSTSSGQHVMPGVEQSTGAETPLRSDSPLGGDGKISMKIQIHITVAPENEPLILDPSVLCSNTPHVHAGDSHSSGSKTLGRKKSNDSTSIGEHIHERLSRQNTLSTRRRQQLMAMHHQPALETATQSATSGSATVVISEDDLGKANGTSTTTKTTTTTTTRDYPTEGRERGARASTITGGIGCDEATARFLAGERYSRPTSPLVSIGAPGSQPLAPRAAGTQVPREHIYFKRDGQRFGHEFTLKLAVDRTYRCLLKVRPLLPLQAISIQGHHVLFADCSQTSSGAPTGGGHSSSSLASLAPASAPASSNALSRIWNHDGSQQQHSPTASSSPLTSANRLAHLNHSSRPAGGQSPHNANYRPRSGLNHASTTDNLMMQHLQSQHFASGYRNSEPINSRLPACLYQQQQSQMMRHFAASHCSSSSNSHLGSQLIYMFDWSASRFEVNKNKNRTQVQTVLKFKNGQILSLPMQIKFYQSECRQHLNWGSQLHFIDYECNINNMGQISVDRVHYY